jgi:methylamine dehydrogenase accessory protein MauD
VTDALLASNLVLWLLVIALGAVVLALTRQVGLLHERIAPAGALAVERGPEVGEPVPARSFPTLAGSPVDLGGPSASGQRTLLFFLSPSCPVCKTLLPTLQRLARRDPTIRLVYASDGTLREHAQFAAREGLEVGSYLLSEELGRNFEVAKLPFAVLIDADGILRAKGLVNTREHLESLFEAERLGVASLQEYLERRDAMSELPAASAASGKGTRA